MYEVRAFRDNRRVGRSERLFRDDDIAKCMGCVGKLAKEGYYSVSIFDLEYNKRVYARREGKGYCFRNYGDKFFNSLKVKSEELLDILVAGKYIPSKLGKYCLSEDNGEIFLVDKVKDRVIFTDLKLNEKDIVDKVYDIISLFDEYLGESVKSYTFRISKDIMSCYFTDSEDEKGSVDLYLDYF